MTSVCIETYGCTLNQSESEELIHQLDGYRLVDFASEAHVVVLNTCMVIEATEQDSEEDRAAVWSAQPSNAHCQLLHGATTETLDVIDVSSVGGCAEFTFCAVQY